LGLIVQSHGSADQGIAGDNTDQSKVPATTQEVHDAIKNGLAGSGHKKVDVLNFDACMMGSEGVANKMKDVAKDMVASAEAEPGLPNGGDGQNVKSALAHLLDRPGQSGSQWADKIVQDSKDGKDRQQPGPGESAPDDWSGTLTLAHYDLRKEGQLHSALDAVGKDLAQSARDPDNKAALKTVMDSSQRYGTMFDPEETQGMSNRDLRQLVQGTMAAIGAGKLHFQSEEEKQKMLSDLRRLESASHQVVRSYSGQTSQNPHPERPRPASTDDVQQIDQARTNYQNGGGMSIFAPSSSSPDALESEREYISQGWYQFLSAMS
jgi:hypothetical protein